MVPFICVAILSTLVVVLGGLLYRAGQSITLYARALDLSTEMGALVLRDLLSMQSALFTVDESSTVSGYLWKAGDNIASRRAEHGDKEMRQLVDGARKSAKRAARRH